MAESPLSGEKRQRMEEPAAAAAAAGGAGADAPATPILYSYWRSSCSYRVRIAMQLKGLAYEYKAVHLLKEGGQQLKDAYAALNPMKEVPTLVIDGLTLNQSTAIIEYLEEAHPAKPLMPKSPADRAVVRQMCNIISNDIQPVGNLRVLKHVASLVEGDAAAKDAKKQEWVRHYIQLGFTALEKLLAEHSGKYSFGDTVTAADCFLVPQVYNAVRFSVDMAAFPCIQRVHDALQELPEFKAAAPAAQPDAE